jgi:hypothetical protein
VPASSEQERREESEEELRLAGLHEIKSLPVSSPLSFLEVSRLHLGNLLRQLLLAAFCLDLLIFIDAEHTEARV